MEKRKINLTLRQVRFADALQRKGRAGIDLSDVVRRALDRYIDDAIARGLISEEDGGPPEAPESNAE